MRAARWTSRATLAAVWRGGRFRTLLRPDVQLIAARGPGPGAASPVPVEAGDGAPRAANSDLKKPEVMIETLKVMPGARTLQNLTSA